MDYTGITNTTILSLVTNACYPDFPDPLMSTELLQDLFDYPINVADNYGDQSEGLLMAPQTGSYVFWLATDDDGELWLSTNTSPTNKVLIASISGYSGQHEWGKFASQQSAPVSLVKGQSYYLFVRHKEGTGGDNVAVGWQLPDGTVEQPMPTLFYEPFSTTNSAAIITQSPVDAGVEDGRMVSFAVNLAPASQAFTYQWYEGSTPIAGATLPGLRFRATLADTGKKYSVRIGSLTSAQANLGVYADNTPPTVVDTDTLGYNSIVRLTLTEPVTPATATNVARYTATGGITIQRASLSADGQTITLVTSQFNPQSTYSLTIQGVADYATTPNLMNSTVQFGAVRGHITRKYYLNITGTAVADLTNNAAFPANYSEMDYTNLFEGRINWADNYGSMLQGWLVPDVTDNYILAISSDDNGALFLSTDADPAHKRPVPIATVTGYTASRVYNGATNQQSTPIRLVAGQKYYIEAIEKEGTGSDNLAVAWAQGGAVGDGTEPIPGANLIPWYDPNVALAITNPPASLTVLQSRGATFSIGVVGTPSYTGLQWYRNGQPIAGANAPSYTVAHASLADDQASYYAVVSNLAYSVQSPAAVLTVLADTTAPQVLLVTTAVGSNVRVTFNEFVDPATATNMANYTISGITFTNAVLDADGLTVILGLTGTLPANFQVTIRDVKDFAGNTLSPNPTVTTGYTTGLAPNMISYWPLDEVQGVKTPDIISGYDLTLQNMTATNLVAGKYGKCFLFDNVAKTLLTSSFPTNQGHPLPVYNYTNFTVSIWVNGPVQSDHRIYCESGTLGNNNPLFSLGTHNTGANGTLDTYIRNNSGTTTGDHHHHAGVVLDNTWRHICFVMQSSNTPKALVYVDGVKDSVNPDPIWPMTMNTVTIGGVVRASAAAWFTGMIDDVAVWSRALAPEEVQFLFTKGTPVPPPKPMPLVINSFSSDLPAIAQGDAVNLRWDVTKDATSVELVPGGNVTAVTTAGVGSRSVSPTYTTTYKLIVRRNEEAVTNSYTLTVIDGIAAGWTLIDNFDRYAPGTLPKPWGFAGSTAVVDVNGNRMLKTGGSADSLAGLAMGNLTVTEGQQRTLFARFWLSAPQAAGAIFEIMGLSDRGIRGWGDINPDLGPDIILQNPNGNLQIGTRNGYGAAIELASYTLLPQTAYNVWIDIQNEQLSAGLADLVSIYIAQEGTATRTTLFKDYRSDRNPNDTTLLGPTAPDLDNLTFGGTTATDLVYWDDFYLSKSGYNSTLPRPFGFSNPALPPSLTVSIGLAGDQITVRYDSGILESAPALTGPWTTVTGAAPPSYTAPASSAQLYFRSKQ